VGSQAEGEQKKLEAANKYCEDFQPSIVSFGITVAVTILSGLPPPGRVLRRRR
jgi:hypothetical protein